ncbi:GM11492 [Drosophila sechellia]|uniref:GM11492 n=1 Tax=Drosophila sechellia TaxID=7238 RepID=B4IGS6_DROSE|nr:GM11492 [Drosophila sechellia]
MPLRRRRLRSELVGEYKIRQRMSSLLNFPATPKPMGRIPVTRDYEIGTVHFQNGRIPTNSSEVHLNRGGQNVPLLWAS